MTMEKQQIRTQDRGPAMTACKHIWIANSGEGGEPKFRMNRQISDYPLMHVKCSGCNARTWFTGEQWEALPEAADDDTEAPQ